MLNPILQQMQNRNRSLISSIKNPAQMYSQLVQSNPQFRQFLEANRGKSIEQIEKEYGIPSGTVNSLMRNK